MAKITQASAVKSAKNFELNYRIHREAIALAENSVKDSIAKEEAAKEELKVYAQQNDATLFPKGVATSKIHGDVVVQRRSGVMNHFLASVSKEDRHYLVDSYPEAFVTLKNRVIPTSDTRAQNILRRCVVVGEPTYIVTLASNSKALKNK